MADFVGFTLNNVHSSDLNIIRVSNGSRFDKNLLPGTNDMSATVTGHDGIYYWGRDFKNYTLTINIAYDSMEEKHMRKLLQLISGREPIELIYDEAPYKKYCVIPTSNSKLNYVCFNKYDTSELKSLYTPGTDIGLGRIYKGEGTLTFTTIEPYCRSTNKYADNYTADLLFDWNEAIGLKKSTGLDTWAVTSAGGTFTVYNAGDKPAKPTVTVLFSNSSTTNTLVLNINSKTMILSNIVLANSDTGLIINSETELITGNVSHNIYNLYLTTGYFDYMLIPSGYNALTGDKTTYTFTVSGENTTISGTPTIEYDYLFV